MKVLNLILIANLAAGPAFGIEADSSTRDPDTAPANPGVITVDFGKPAAPPVKTQPIRNPYINLPGAVDSNPTYANPANYVPPPPPNQVTDSAGNVYTLPSTNGSDAGDTVGPGMTGGQLNFSQLTCDQKCDMVNGAYDAALEAPVCGQSQTCSSCVIESVSRSQTGRYCAAKGEYKRATRAQNGRSALYFAGAAICLAGCLNKEPISGAVLQAACKVSSIGTALSELIATKKLSEPDEKASKWLKATEKTATVANAGLAALFVGEKLGVKIAEKALGEVAGKAAGACLAFKLLSITAVAKRVNTDNYKNAEKDLCQQINRLGDAFSPSASSCTKDNGQPVIANQLLAYSKPKPFDAGSDDSKSAITEGGLIDELYKGDMKPLEEVYNALDPKIKARFESGEDPMAVARSSGMIPSSILDEAETLAKGYGPGVKSAFFNSEGAMTTIANLGKNKNGSGVMEESFGSASVAPSAAGEGVTEASFGAGSDTAFSSVCGQGPFHEGCDRSIFRIVSDKLSVKSKDQSVANLNPVLPLNQMRAGLKVEGKRAPASSHSTVK